ncbi:ribbon-helix-helix protein, CopG family [Sphingomonas koreensis]|uniref:Ribbon-helix-helix protein, CopG family n=1 Tax=Sphingomonas koreensis TaxID=93064 RepID=A0AAJ4V9Z6_9SPHN|nr:ribbon-helix-helix domain-containing protein [Sphingomonas koreensis]MDC7809937.1 ribbon-helix-helix domain-containing protein [Sphingomonas koreensis]RSU24500.1 ribbon-helix-helix protein, CopG family [Sphingomonas koreensis]RSU25145.1 ribbon-helix-helix protein, CopG family [Sphingomonas koreensis]RSU30180.1 ribbon-helix-helix protein, CopG family [Sphingomonas koreensis]RSU37383.1 ribbon-helix-helix protein, CopG family [Sphingomonas koreensis]
MPVRIDPDLLGDIDLYCAYAGCSRSEVVREALERWRESYGEILASMKRAEPQSGS